MADEEYEALRVNLRPRLTDEFLATLVEAARVDGNSSDWPATLDFVRNTFDVAGKDMPAIQPYE